MKIATLFTIATMTLGSFLVVQGGGRVVSTAQDYQTEQQLRDLIALRGVWFKGLTSLSIERSLSQVQLSMETGTDGEVAQMRRDQRLNTQKIFDDFLAQMMAGDEFPMRAELAEDMELALAAVAQAHADIDAQMQRPLAERDAEVAHDAIEVIKDYIVDMKGMTVHMVVENDVTPTQATLMMRLQETVFDTREYAGRARSMYAIATLHQRALTSAEHEYVAANLHRAREAWAGVAHVYETIDLPENVMQNIQETENLLLQGYYQIVEDLDRQMQMAQDAAAQAATATGTATPATDAATAVLPVAYTMPFATFFETTTQALNAPAELIQSTGEQLDLLWHDIAIDQRNSLLFDLAVLVLSIAIIAVSLWIVSQKVTRKLAQAMHDLDALTAGNIHQDLTPAAKDLAEIKDLTQGLGQLQEQLQRADAAKQELIAQEAAQKQIVDRLSDGLRAMSAGNLTMRLTDRFDARYQSLADNFNAANDALARVVSQVVETAGTILTGTRGISAATVDLSQRTETQGVTLQNAAAALEQLTRNIVGSQRDATELDALANLASEKGNAMTTTMGHTVEAIEKIKSSSQQIEQIVGVMEDIAFQTNLLALNAGVEATRAGSEGSGFAVIASEVRSLAERSAQSAQDIKTLIAASGVEVSKGVEFVAEAEASVGDIGTHIKMISGLITRIATAASEQSQGLVKVNDGVSQLDLVTQTNVAMVEETTAECASLASVAQELSQLVAKFQVDGQTGSQGRMAA
jgi:methyl-accepting chemotaxis protein